MTTRNGNGQLYERAEMEFVPNMGRFKLTDCVFSKQYYSYYQQRLASLRQRVCDEAVRKFNGYVAPELNTSSDDEVEQELNRSGQDGLPIRRMSDLRVEERCVLVGTIYKEMKLKPNVLQDIGQELNIVRLPTYTGKSFVSADSDLVILEDRRQRIRLRGNIDTGALVTGCVIALLGVQHESQFGWFQVEDYCFAPMSSAKVEWPIRQNDLYIAFISGLEIGSQRQEQAVEMQMMLDFVSGHMGDSSLQDLCAQIGLVVICGNSLSPSTLDRDILNRARYLEKNVKVKTMEAVAELDNVLVQLTHSVAVHLMPGEFDPAHCMLPQQPMHRCLFPLATGYQSAKSKLRFVTNPYDGQICNVRLLGTSGRNVSDLLRYSTAEDETVAMERLIEWAHLCPTGPDTLCVFPYTDRDPFVLVDRPHVMFAGNQDRFAAKKCLKTGVVFLSVPSFSKTAQIALLNLRTGDSRSVGFRVK